MDNEWELLCIADDIEVGDTVIVEYEDDQVDMVFVKVQDGKIILSDEEGKKHKFRPSTLEEWGADGFIIGKSKNELKLRT